MPLNNILFAIFELSYGKILRMFTLKILEIQLYFPHFRLNVPARNDALCTLDVLALVVKSIQQNRYLSLQGNIIETPFPLRVCRARALRSDAQPKRSRLPRRFRQIVCHTSMLGTPHRDTTHFFETIAQWPKEPLFLHEEVTLQAFGKGIQLAYEKVPIARVWCQTYNILGWTFDGHISCPAQSFIKDVATEFLPHKKNNMRLMTMISMKKHSDQC